MFYSKMSRKCQSRFYIIACRYGKASLSNIFLHYIDVYIYIYLALYRTESNSMYYYSLPVWPCQYYTDAIFFFLAPV